MYWSRWVGICVFQVQWSPDVLVHPKLVSTLSWCSPKGRHRSARAEERCSNGDVDTVGNNYCFTLTVWLMCNLFFLHWEKTTSRGSQKKWTKIKYTDTHLTDTLEGRRVQSRRSKNRCCPSELSHWCTSLARKAFPLACTNNMFHNKGVSQEKVWQLKNRNTWTEKNHQREKRK